jgi:hypothetical protein
MLAISLLGNIIANRTSEKWEIGLTIGAFLVMYISAITYLFVRWDIDLLSKDEDELFTPELVKERDEAISFVV